MRRRGVRCILLSRPSGRLAASVMVVSASPPTGFAAPSRRFACWIVVWVAMMSLGLEKGQRVVGRQGRDGYLAMTGFPAILLIPIGLGCATFVLW